MSLNYGDDNYVLGPDGRLLERHLYRGLKGATIRANSVFLLDDEDKLGVASVQTAFENCENLVIQGGFYGINSPTAAREYAELQHHRQLEWDRAQFVLERERIALERERQQLMIEQIRAQRLGWGYSTHDQFMAPNLNPGFIAAESTFYGEPTDMDGYQFAAWRVRQGNGFPSAPGTYSKKRLNWESALNNWASDLIAGQLPHSQSESQVPKSLHPRSVPSPYCVRAHTENTYVRQVHPLFESDTSTHTNSSRLKEILPEVPRHTPRSA